jgi:hypothetical protein
MLWKYCKACEDRIDHHCCGAGAGRTDGNIADRSMWEKNMTYLVPFFQSLESDETKFQRFFKFKGPRPGTMGNHLLKLFLTHVSFRCTVPLSGAQLGARGDGVLVKPFYYLSSVETG